MPAGPASANTTVPVGEVAPELEVSVTVAVQLDAWLMTTGVPQLTVVDVGWPWVATLKDAGPLPVCVESPSNEAVMLWWPPVVGL